MSSPTPSPANSPGRSIRGRMGTLMRRTSSALSFTRPISPSNSDTDSTKRRGSIDEGSISKSRKVDKDGDASSIKSSKSGKSSKSSIGMGRPSLAPVESLKHTMVPSPIAESPAREDAELDPKQQLPVPQQNVSHHSPLSHQVISATPESMSRATSEAQHTEEAEQTIPAPSPMIIDAAGSNVVTEEPSSISDAKDDSDAGHSTDAHNGAANEPEFVKPQEAVISADAPESVKEEEAPVSVKEEEEAPVPVKEEEEAPVLVKEEEAPVSIEEEVAEPVKDESSQANTTVPSIKTEEPAEEVSSVPSTRPRTGAAFSYFHPKPSGSTDAIPVEQVPSKDSDVGYIPGDLRRVVATYPSNENVWDMERVLHANGSKTTLNDPFADPVPPVIVVNDQAPIMPIPIPAAEATRGLPEAFVPRAPSLSTAPSLTHSEHVHRMPSIPSIKASSSTNEREPLLAQSSESRITSYLQPQDSPHAIFSPIRNGAFPSISAGPSITSDVATNSNTRLRSLGWLEYSLPDSTSYYVHPTLRITSDIDLRDTKKLDAVSSYIDGGQIQKLPVGTELWLRDGPSKKSKGDVFTAVRYWIDHEHRSAKGDVVWKANGDGSRKGKVVEEDELDQEYRYWSFIESHPAHATLPKNARAEALDVLTWSWTDRVLPSPNTIPAPFSQGECQELMGLLRSFDDSAVAHTEMQAIMHSRVVARILMRTAQWRQVKFRPHKALPQVPADQPNAAARRPSSFRQTLADIFASTVCLGIPYAFMSRMYNHRFDEEGFGSMRSSNAGPMMMIAGCACLVAAIVLSASVTFLSLPGMDGVARVVAIVAALLAASSMISTVVAVFQYKADMERAALMSAWAGDGLVVFSRSHIVMSLPVVLLVYSIIAFVVGISLYSARGVTLTSKDIIEKPFELYTRWTVLGFLGGMMGVMAAAVFLRN